MQIAISTIDREPAFVHKLLDTLFVNDQAEGLRIRCVVNGDDDGYLQHWDQIETEVLDEKGMRELASFSTKRRIFFNTMRCLVDADHSDSLLYCQDDVIFCSNWRSKLNTMISKAPDYLRRTEPRHRAKQRSEDRYVLSLYASYPFKTRPVASYPTQKFYGMQCVYFPQVVLKDIALKMADTFRGGRCPPDDIWLKESCMRQDLPILCGIPNLVQHVGNGSTIGSSFHTSPTFQE